MQGYLLKKIDGDKGTNVVYLENVDPGGLLKGLIIGKVLPKKIRDSVDDLLSFAQDKQIDENFDIF